MRSGRSLVLHVRCGNCMKLYRNDVAIPDCSDVIEDDDLVHSHFVREMGFRCPKCEAVYAEIVAYQILDVHMDLAS